MQSNYVLFYVLKAPVCKNQTNSKLSSFEALNYDMVLKASRAKTDYATVFKTAQSSFTTPKYLLKWFGENRSVLCIQSTVADPGEGPLLFLDQTEARRAEKLFWRPPPALSQGLDDRAHLPPLSQGLDPALK